MVAVDTNNYFEVALRDDKAAEEDGGKHLELQASQTPSVADDKKAIRKARIAAAVQRSKTEYTRDQVYTERTVSESSMVI